MENFKKEVSNEDYEMARQKYEMVRKTIKLPSVDIKDFWNIDVEFEMVKKKLIQMKLW